MTAKQVEDRILAVLAAWDSKSIFESIYIMGLEAAFMRKSGDLETVDSSGVEEGSLDKEGLAHKANQVRDICMPDGRPTLEGKMLCSRNDGKRFERLPLMCSMFFSFCFAFFAFFYFYFFVCLEAGIPTEGVSALDLWKRLKYINEYAKRKASRTVDPQASSNGNADGGKKGFVVCLMFLKPFLWRGVGRWGWEGGGLSDHGLCRGARSVC